MQQGSLISKNTVKSSMTGTDVQETETWYFEGAKQHDLELDTRKLRIWAPSCAVRLIVLPAAFLGQFTGHIERPGKHG